MIDLTGFLKPKKPKQTVIFIEIAGRQIEILLSRNKRAKRLTLRQNLSGGNFKLSMPIRGTIAQAEDFCGQHTSWITDKSVNMRDMIMFEHDQHIPLRGGQVKLVFLDQLRGQTQQKLNELHVTGGTDYAPRRLTTWLKAEAKADILIAIEKYQPLLDVKHNKLTIRDTKSRWGSCSSSKALSFSWRLVLAPPNVLDYVVAHELAHILEMNHSATFWGHVDKVCPHMKDSRNWLKTKGGQLHQIRVK
ncbi:MAG: hypothetical protein COB24_04200 [Hyphomicrobiales bacterium]|nr:MAG: hypothetical protein COB24_04200 [Hyphomicrobiales bacterium]